MRLKTCLVNIFCKIIPSKRFSESIKQYFLATSFINKGNNNIVVVVRKNGTKKILKKNMLNTNIRFLGDDNYIEIHEPISENFYLSCKLNTKTKIIIGERFNGGLNIYSDSSIFPNKVILGKGSVVTKTLVIDLARGNANVEIGDSCLFSWGNEIRTGDHHAIYKKGTRKLLNPNQDVKFGKHIWVGSNALILKGVHIADGSVIGANSVVTKPFAMSNVAIAGIPAKIIKKDIEWGYEAP